MATLTDILSQASDAFLSKGEVSQRYDEVRSDAAERAARLLDEARREGAGFLALAARHGAEVARDYGLPLLTSGRRRRRSHWRLWVAAAAIAAATAVVLSSRD
jgi:hypothetical protein